MSKRFRYSVIILIDRPLSVVDQTLTLLSGEKVELHVEGAEVTSAGSDIVYQASIIYTNYRLICVPSADKDSEGSIRALVQIP